MSLKDEYDNTKMYNKYTNDLVNSVGNPMGIMKDMMIEDMKYVHITNQLD